MRKCACYVYKLLAGRYCYYFFGTAMHVFSTSERLFSVHSSQGVHRYLIVTVYSGDFEEFVSVAIFVALAKFVDIVDAEQHSLAQLEFGQLFFHVGPAGIFPGPILKGVNFLEILHVHVVRRVFVVAELAVLGGVVGGHH